MIGNNLFSPCSPRYRIVPFNHSNKIVDGVESPQLRPAHVEIVAFTTEPVSVGSLSVDLVTYVSALRKYILAKSSHHDLNGEPTVTKYTRHDGQGTLMWIDNLAKDKEVLHAMQFQTHDGIKVNRAALIETGQQYEDVIPPSSGKLVIVAYVLLLCRALLCLLAFQCL
jgi:hypothetical protein